MLQKKIKKHVGKKEVRSIIEQYSKKKIKTKDFKILDITELLYPYYAINNVIKIKRAFGLKPRIIKHLYWVNALDGSMLRTKDIPELENIKNAKTIEGTLDKEKCIRLCKDNAFKHVMRFYKSFWTPKTFVEDINDIYISYWKVQVMYDEEYEKTFLINSFSGQIIEKKENNNCA